MPLADIKKYFLWSTIAGCIWVVLSAFFGWQVFGVLGSIAFMLLYIAAYEKSSRETNSKAHLSTFANSLYFQGFLLTVWALIISLVVWGALRGVSITPGDVLSRIGIALVTTFIGLGGRTLYIQFYESAEDVERAAHHGLTEKSAQLAGELSASIHAIRTVRSEFVVEIESMRESIKSAKSDQEKSTIATAKLLAESFNKEVQTAITSIVDYQIKHSQDVAALTSSLGNASQQLEASAISLAKAGKAIQEIN